MSTRERLLVPRGAVVVATTIYKLLFATSTKVFEFRFSSATLRKTRNVFVCV